MLLACKWVHPQVLLHGVRLGTCTCSWDLQCAAFTRDVNTLTAASAIVCWVCVCVQVFGLPSVRTDVPLPVARSVANTHNYGNEPTAYQLLTPPKCVDLGVKEEHLLQPRSRHEMQELLGAAGIGMADDDFDAVFGLAVALSGAAGGAGGEGECSLEELMQARQQYLKSCAGLG